MNKTNIITELKIIWLVIALIIVICFSNPVFLYIALGYAVRETADRSASQTSTTKLDSKDLNILECRRLLFFSTMTQNTSIYLCSDW
jgi:hypothetical protein